jgi:hypothetical protein
MWEYLRRTGIAEGRRVLIFSGNDGYIKRAFLNAGWAENANLQSAAFHLKWVTTDTDADYRMLKPGQRFNHFQGNRDLTTKSGLVGKFRNVTEYGANTESFFPRSYDMGD